MVRMRLRVFHLSAASGYYGTWGGDPNGRSRRKCSRANDQTRWGVEFPCQACPGRAEKGFLVRSACVKRRWKDCCSRSGQTYKQMDQPPPAIWIFSKD